MQNPGIPGFFGTGLTYFFHPGIDGIPGFFGTGLAVYFYPGIFWKWVGISFFDAICDQFRDFSQFVGFLSFLLHRQDFRVNFCSTQECVKCDKMDDASKQRKSQKETAYIVNLSCGAMTRYSPLQMWSNLSLIHTKTSL